jgi:excisionase family DNA binding protein
MPINGKNKPSADTANSATYLTKQEAAKLLKVTTRYLERAVSSGRLRALKPTGKLWRVRQSDLDAFLESGASMGGDE